MSDDIDWGAVRDLTKAQQKRWEDWQTKKAREHLGRRAPLMSSTIALGYAITYEELEANWQDL